MTSRSRILVLSFSILAPVFVVGIALLVYFLVPRFRAENANNTAAKRACTSFDVFDTLIGRRVNDPTDVYDIVEAQGISGFKALRIQAQKQSDCSWHSIYAEYDKLSLCGTRERARIQELELCAEESVVYLIRSNASRVRDGDVLVSDMYLPSHAIRRLLRKAGFATAVNLHVSCDGKSSGAIWPKLQKLYSIKVHVGDNAHSDGSSPKECGIPTEVTAAYRFNWTEEYLFSEGARACGLALRQFRLQSPTPQYDLGRMQFEFNLLLLLHMSHIIGKIASAECLHNILLCTRDGCLLEYILPVLYPSLNCVRFHTSRMAYRNSNAAYDAYLRSVYIPNETVIFDLHGTFNSGRATFMRVFGHLPRVHLFDTYITEANKFPGFTFSYTTIGDWLERINLDVVGPLVEITSAGKDIRAPPAYDIPPATEAHSIVKSFAEFIQTHETAFHQLSLLPQQWLHILSEAKGRRLPNNVKQYKDDDDSQSLTEVANTKSTPKGTLYGDKHGYTHHYQHILNPFNTQTRITLLEIGLSSFGSTSTPSLDMWEQYYGSRVRTVGFDKDRAFTRCTAASRNIIIGNQSSPKDLARCSPFGPYDIIIDNGSHISAHQQVSLKCLWPLLKTGGVYVIENLHQDDTKTTANMLQKWENGSECFTEFMDEVSAELVRASAIISFYKSFAQSTQYDEAQLQYAMAVLTKVGI